MVTDLRELQRKYGDGDFQVVGVTRLYGYGTDFADRERPKLVGRKGDRLSEDAETALVGRWLRAFEVDYPVVIVPREVSRQYAVFAIPALFLLDRRGNVRGVGTGQDRSHLEALIPELIAEADPEVGKR